MDRIRPVVNRRRRRRESRQQPSGVRVGRKGRVRLYRNGVEVRDRNAVLSAFNRTQ